MRLVTGLFTKNITQENLKVVPNIADLTTNHEFHFNVEQTHRDGAVASLMKYASKPFSLYDTQMMTNNNSIRSSRNPAGDQIHTETRPYIRATFMGSIEASQSPLEYHHVKIDAPVAVYIVQLENKRNFIIRHQSVPSNLSNSPLSKYFKQPSQYQGFQISEYMVYGAIPSDKKASNIFTITKMFYTVGYSIASLLRDISGNKR